jgi:hypothetical protein
MDAYKILAKDFDGMREFWRCRLKYDDRTVWAGFLWLIMWFSDNLL